MRCPECHSTQTRVVDTRTSRGGRAVRRRRECETCSSRFTTYEFVEERPIRVLKASGDSEEYDRSKLVRSLMAACAKRPISASEVDELVEEIEESLSRLAGVEVSSVRLSEMVMSRLRGLDRVAYVRYASVYRNFRDLDEFQDFVSDVRARQRREQLNRDQVELPLSGSQTDGDGQQTGQSSG
jgi:transcriptional repressor NrdR